MEKELYNALALVLLQNTKDQWGNEVQSPLMSALSRWAEENKETIQVIILDKIHKDEFSDEIVKKITKDLSWMSSDWNRNYTKEKLQDLIMQKLAEKLAEEELNKLTRFRVRFSININQYENITIKNVKET